MTQPDDTGGSGTGLRLVFEYSGSEIRLIQQTAVATVPPAVGVPNDAQAEYIEVRDENDQPLARVPVHPAMNESLEVFPENHDEPIVRSDVQVSQGAFSVVIPAPQAARRVGLLRQQRGEASGGGSGGGGPTTAPAPAAQVLGVFELEGR